MKVYKTTDKIPLKIDNIEIKFSPLSYQQKQEVMSMMTEAQKNNELAKLNDGIVLALKYSLKEVTGLNNMDESEYALSFEDDKVSSDSIDVLMNLPITGKLMQVCGKILNGIPEEFDIEGVSFVKN